MQNLEENTSVTAVLNIFGLCGALMVNNKETLCIVWETKRNSDHFLDSSII